MTFFLDESDDFMIDAPKSPGISFDSHSLWQDEAIKRAKDMFLSLHADQILMLAYQDVDINPDVQRYLKALIKSGIELKKRELAV